MRLALALVIQSLAATVAVASDHDEALSLEEPAVTTPRLLLTPFVSVPMLTLDARQKSGDGALSANYRPVVSPNLGLSVAYGGIALSFSEPVPQHNASDDPTTVRSTYQDYRFELFRDYFGLQAGWHQYKGFNQTTTSTTSGDDGQGSDGSDDDSDSVSRRGDLAKSGRFVDVTIIPLGGGDMAFGRGIEEAGLTPGKYWSPVLQMGYEREGISASGALLPTSAPNALSGAEVQSFVLAAGLAAVARFDDWQSSALITFGRTQQFADLETVDGGRVALGAKLGERFAFRLTVERRIDDWIYGGGVSFDRTTLALGDVTLTSTFGAATISMGRIL